MKTQKKISVLLVSVVMILVIIFTIYQYIRSRETMLYQKSLLQSDKLVIEKVLEFKCQGFLKPTKDNSAWDGMVDFTKTKDSVWAKENLDAVLITFDMSFLGAYDVEGNLIYAAYDSVSDGLFLEKRQIAGFFFHDKVIHTFMLFQGHLYEIFGAAIVPTSDIFYHTSAQGYLVAAKQWNDHYISELEKTTGFKILMAEDENGLKQMTERDSENIIHPVTNQQGKVLRYIQFSRNSMFTNELKKLDSVKLPATILILICFLLFFFFTSRWLNKPLKMITKSLANDDLKPISFLLEQKGEFGDISRLIKQFHLQKNDLLIENREKKEATEKYRALLRAQPDMMFILDRSGNFLDYYAADIKMLLKAPEGFLGQNLSGIFSPDLVQKLMKSLKDIEYGKTIKPIEYEMEVNHVVYSFEARLTAIDQERILAIVRDITERRVIEAKLISALEKARESDRLKSAFLANMSHEIRTPMNGILGFSELLNDETLSAEDRQKYTGIINSSGRQLLALINDILDISKLDYNQMAIDAHQFSLNRLLDSILISSEKEKSRLGKKHIGLELVKNLEDAQSYLETDELKLMQILQNLIGNALKYTTKGFIKFGYTVKENHLLFFVEDSGKGISGEKLEIIFERFRQEEESNSRTYGGAGLGLAISKGLINLLGGSIWVKSEVKKGSTFFFTLPFNQQLEPVPVNPVFIPAGNSNDFTGKIILIAEDILENFELMEAMLIRLHPTLIHAENGLKALEIVASGKSIDLIIMDIRMPVMDGYEATREIRKLKPDIPIIALTAHAFEEDKIRCTDAGCNDFISKPINKEKLIRILRKFLL